MSSTDAFWMVAADSLANSLSPLSSPSPPPPHAESTASATIAPAPCLMPATNPPAFW